MAFSNSFHSSAKAHSIKNASALAKVQSHNSRDYFSLERSKNKSYDIIGTAGTLAADVQDYINVTFNNEIAAYNKKQRRKDRRIDKDAFQYFCDNKATDIANEVIFQIADKEFWDQFREDKVIKRKGKEYVLHSYPEHVVKVMNEIYKLQAEAYEKIYETHRDIIIDRINKAYDEAQAVVEGLYTDTRWKYYQIVLKAQKQPKFKREECRERMMSEMNFSDEEIEKFADFFEAHETIRAIEEARLRERTAAGEMEIKLISLAGHGDEKSYHGHGVSVCSVGGYKQGLQRRIAKTVVLNKYALEVLQDRMREIAQEEMDKHPEIFEERQLDPKGIGRNMDYSVEQHIRIKQEELLEKGKVIESVIQESKEQYDQIVERVSKLKKERGTVRNEVSQLKEERNKASQELAAILNEYNKTEEKIAAQKEKSAQWDEILYVIKTEQEYLAEAEASEDTIEHLNNLCKSLIERKSPLRDKSIEQAFLEAFRGFYEALSRSLKRLRGWEIYNELPDEQCYSTPLINAKKDLDNQINNAEVTKKTRQSITHEYQQRKKTEDRSI